ncbi:hypothetical protein DXG01_007140 [Tephrocybe rancida]|nr:hypothetical protein DXG01_007140 [Tephrocybe rancida]
MTSRRDSGTPRPPSSSLNPTLSPAPSTPTTPHANHPTEAPRRSAPSTPPPQKSRARDLLRKHYGLGVGPPPPIPGKAAVDPMNLDSTAFDAKTYYEQLITTSSLPGLLKRENELLTGMYLASLMKTRAESLDADLDLLKVAFSEISRISSEVAIEAPEAENS